MMLIPSRNQDGRSEQARLSTSSGGFITLGLYGLMHLHTISSLIGMTMCRRLGSAGFVRPAMLAGSDGNERGDLEVA